MDMVLSFHIVYVEDDMFIRKMKRKNGEVSIVLVEGYRVNGKVKQRTIKYLGTESSLIKDDPLAIEKLIEKYKKLPHADSTIELVLQLSEKIPENNCILNYGYFWIEKFYNDLGLDGLLSSNDGKKQYNLNKITKFMVYSRCLYPGSRLDNYLHQDRFFESYEFELQQLYKSLTDLNNIKDKVIDTCHTNLCNKYNRDTSLLYYDVTNYFFEIDDEDKLRKRGVSKENRLSPIIQMGLFIDRLGLPVDFYLFPGNTPDCITLKPSFEKIKNKYKSEKVIITADKGLNSNSNIGYILSSNNGYIISQRIRGASSELRSKVLEEQGWIIPNESCKFKEFIREIKVKYPDNTVHIHKQKVVCIWSQKYWLKENSDREHLLDYIIKLASNPTKFKQKCHLGSKKYIDETIVDKKTLQKIDSAKILTSINSDKIAQDYDLDGYYLIVTSEINLSIPEIIKKYRGLWRIEESFRITKSDLSTRPVYVQTQEHIIGHFLICFLSLLILRMIELKLNNKYSVSKIRKALHSAQCSRIGKAVYALNKRHEAFVELETIYDCLINQHYIKEEDLRTYYKKVLKNIYTTSQNK